MRPIRSPRSHSPATSDRSLSGSARRHLDVHQCEELSIMSLLFSSERWSRVVVVGEGRDPDAATSEAPRLSRTRFPLAVDHLKCRALLSTLTVTNTNDSGTGSLRDAIATANSRFGRREDRLRFAGLRHDRPIQRPFDHHQQHGNRRARRAEVGRQRPRRCASSSSTVVVTAARASDASRT